MPIHKALQPWNNHLAAYRRSHPSKSLKQCMIEASKTYKKKKQKGSGFPKISAADAAKITREWNASRPSAQDRDAMEQAGINRAKLRGRGSGIIR
jgi:hypothetical protein